MVGRRPDLGSKQLPALDKFDVLDGEKLKIEAEEELSKVERFEWRGIARTDVLRKVKMMVRNIVTAGSRSLQTGIRLGTKRRSDPEIAYYAAVGCA